MIAFLAGLVVVGGLMAVAAWVLVRDPWECRPRRFGPLCAGCPDRPALQKARIAPQTGNSLGAYRPLALPEPQDVIEITYTRPVGERAR